MRKHISPATVIAAAALFFSLTGAGMAATGYRITSIWQIVPKVRHELRGAQGPQGTPGPQGPQGLQGAVGPQGPARLQGPTIDNLTVAEGNQVAIPPGGSAYSVAVCTSHSGHYVWATIGGYVADPGADAFYNTSLGLEWQTGATNSTSQPIKLQAWAICLTGTSFPTSPG